MTGQFKVPEGGYEIVLTASRAEMADYGLDPFLAFYCTFPNGLFPRSWEKKFYEEGLTRNQDGSARFALYGLRKVEALLKNNFGRDRVVVCHSPDLAHFVGPNTKIIGISSMDPVSLAYVSTTYNSLIGIGGEGLNAAEFKRMMANPVFRDFKGTVLMGGAGVWQINEAKMRGPLGIDVLFHGMAERELVALVKKLLAGEKVPTDVHGGLPDYDTIPQIQGAATYGMVEITRGCGRGCAFCTPTMRKRHNVPIEKIVEEVRLNVAAGSKMAFLATEDIFLYGCKARFVPDKHKLKKMLSAVAAVPGLKYIQISHAALAPIVYDKSVLEEITPVLMEKTRWSPEYKKSYKKKFITVEVGVETGSARLMNKSMRGKALPFKADSWRELVVQGFQNMNEYEWWPLATLMTGLPDETEEDLIQTLELIDDLKGTKSFLTPLVFIPIEEAVLSDAKRVDMDRLSERQWEFIANCWKHNIDYWAQDEKWWITPFLLACYWGITRWKHGSKSFRPAMRMIGFPGDLVGWGTRKRCDPSFCRDPPLDVVPGVPKDPTEFSEMIEKALGGDEDAMRCGDGAAQQRN
ncbi:MAG: B12-binding domain-containing radical SAM protein [Euryarchaeota archaeon]|nr:B12-binding domain-containing radical SAM protein [Euryarchaeota archaeon]